MQRIISMTDWHCPFHDLEAIELAIKFARDLKPIQLIIHETNDWYSISKFNKDPNRKETLQDDLDVTVGLLKYLRSNFKKIPIIMLKSNHDARLKKYLSSDAKGLSSLRCLTITEQLKLNELEIAYKAYEFFRKTVLWKHGDYIRAESAYTAKQELLKEGVSGCSGHCFSDTTEVLTASGWKLFSNIEIGEPVLTVNPKSLASEWNLVRDVFSYSHYYEMVQFKNTVANLMVTKKHGILYTSRYAIGPIKTTQADNLVGKRVDIPCGGKNTLSEYNIDDNFLKLCAWVITEGCYDSPNIRISQSDKPKVGPKYITDLLDTLDIGYSNIKRYDAGKTQHGQHRNYNAYRITLHECSLTQKIKTLFPDKQINNFVYQLSHRQFKLFFHELILGDGCKNKDAKRSYQYGSKYETEIDVLQGLCALNGYRASKLKRQRNGSIFYILTINTRGYSSFEKGGKVVPYKGLVWCATVDNGTLVVRNENKNIVACNTHRLGVHWRSDRINNAVWVENGCLCSLAPEWVKGPVNWQTGVGVFTFKDGKKHFHPGYAQIINGEILFGDKLYRI